MEDSIWVDLLGHFQILTVLETLQRSTMHEEVIAAVDSDEV